MQTIHTWAGFTIQFTEWMYDRTYEWRHKRYDDNVFEFIMKSLNLQALNLIKYSTGYWVLPGAGKHICPGRGGGLGRCDLSLGHEPDRKTLPARPTSIYLF